MINLLGSGNLALMISRKFRINPILNSPITTKNSLHSFFDLRHIQENKQSVCRSISRHTASACSPNPEVRGQKPDGIRLGYSFLISDLWPLSTDLWRRVTLSDEKYHWKLRIDILFNMPKRIN